ncbi:MAG TPA: glycosyltransferase family 39 protein [Candidatus Binatia bacterium]|nr:glycosyltransferase family 39 protein [Candidatus Binatia bacterium]
MLGLRNAAIRTLRCEADAVVSTCLAIPLAVGLLLAPPIHTRGEAREGMVVRSVTRGDWVLPRREGRVPSKPPLFHWTAAMAARVFGLSDTTIRLPSLIAAWLILVVTMRMGAEMGGRRVGWLACGALLCMPAFWAAALEARVDMVFAACVCVSIACGHRAVRPGDTGARVLCYAATAAAVLAKGPAGAALPTLIFGARTLLRPRAATVTPLWSGSLATLAAAIVLGWYGAAAAMGGREFVDVQLLRENLDRALGLRTFAGRRRHAPLKLVGAFIVHLAPWNLAVVASAVQWYRDRRLDDDGILLHAWWIVVLAAFTIAAGKRSIYLLPLYPAVALLAGRVLASRVPMRWLPATACAMVLFAVGVGASTVQASWRDARSAAPLLSFAQQIDDVVTPDAGLQTSWGLSENDRLVLAFRLDRALPRADLHVPETEYVVAALPVGDKLQRHCAAVVDGPSSRHAALALLRCTACGSPPSVARGLTSPVTPISTLEGG